MQLAAPHPFQSAKLNTLNTIWKLFNVFLHGMCVWVVAEVATALLEIWVEGKGTASLYDEINAHSRVNVCWLQ